jgi:hypothetical protein
MDKIKINKGRMYRATDLVLDKYASLYSEHAELIDACLKLKAGINLIEEQQQVQVVDNTGLTQTKVVLRVELTGIILKFSNGLKALATLQKDADLLKKSTFKLSDLNKLADPVLYDVGFLLFYLASSFREQLLHFFITDDDFTLMEAKLLSLKAAIPQKRLATTVSKVSTKKLNEVFQTNDHLLKEVIDIFVAPFQYAYPDFYNEYKNARMIVGYTGRGKTKKEETVV